MRLINWLQGITRGNADRVDRRRRRERRSSPRSRRLRLLRHESLEERAVMYGGNGLQFNISHTAAVPQQVKDAFQVAANQWSALLTDDILVNVTVDYTPTAAGVGQALRANTIKSLTEITDALVAQQRSPADVTAVAHLPSGGSAALYTTNFHTGVPFLDDNGTDNNMFFTVTRANAKALGLRAANDPATDGTIKFHSGVAFDYNQSDGIAAGRYDFVGVAMHEIGHLLGFISGADVVDFKSKPNGAGYSALANQDNQIVAYPFDLFRHSAASVAAGADFDLRADPAAKYFSLDGGATQLAPFSTGRHNGNGSENQHWRDNLGIGVMDPTLGYAEYGDVTWLDAQALDVIGWDVAMDYGDAPDIGAGTGTADYQSQLADNGPRHVLFSPSGLLGDPVGLPKVFLGTSVDPDLNGQPDSAAGGDDNDGIDDETGIASLPPLVAGTTVDLTVTSSATAAKNARLNYFFDFNQNGLFDDAGESFSATLTSPSQAVPVVIPAGASLGTTYARFRISSAGNLGPTGPANDGEVEDYSVSIEPAADGGNGAVVLTGTLDNDVFTVTYLAASILVSRSTNGAPPTLLGSYLPGTSLVVDALGGTDQLSLVLTPQKLGDLTTADILLLKNYLAAPAGQTLQLVVPASNNLASMNFETANLTIDDDGRVADITPCLSAINNESQIQIGGDGGDDMLVGTNLVDLIFGQGGNDLLYALDGADCLFGGAGNDTIHGGNANDLLSGGSGDDALVGGANDDVLDGGVGADSVLGGTGADTIRVRADEALLDVIDGGDHSDTIANDKHEPVVIGNFNAATSKVENWTGNNQPIYGTDAANVMNFMITSVVSMNLTGVPFIDGRGGNDVITGTMNNDVLRGGDGDDRLYGMSGNDVLEGGAGNDVLGGGDGGDYLFGGDGADTIATGAGRDIVTFSGDTSSLDVITDFALSLDYINLKPYGISYAMLSFDLVTQPGSTIITLPGGKKIRLLNWSAVVPQNQIVF